MWVVLEKIIRNSLKINRLILKSEERFSSKENNVTEKVNRISLSANYDKIVQSINSIEA